MQRNYCSGRRGNKNADAGRNPLMNGGSGLVTSLPEPGRKLLTVTVRPGAGNGASITLRMKG